MIQLIINLIHFEQVGSMCGTSKWRRPSRVCDLEAQEKNLSCKYIFFESTA